MKVRELIEALEALDIDQDQDILMSDSGVFVLVTNAEEFVFTDGSKAVVIF